MKYQGKSEWWLGIGENKTGLKYCRNCGRPPFQDGVYIENPYTGEKEQWLPPFCPHCGADMYGNNKHDDGWTKCEDRLPENAGSYIVSGRMKYDFEKEYTYFTDVADYRPYDGCWDGNAPLGNTGGTRWQTFNDWYEGQQEYEIVAWIPMPNPYLFDKVGK